VDVGIPLKGVIGTSFQLGVSQKVGPILVLELRRGDLLVQRMASFLRRVLRHFI